ncbi:MAG: hypothetical protein E5Y56_04220 [Mesorhizobium sp.]|nr:MAG: hypothetical protein E5Y56_04220 [Mesorhizobium sp.]
MRQRLLNGALAGALAALFCLMARPPERGQTRRGSASCGSENRILKRQVPSCEICLRRDVRHRREEREQLRRGAPSTARWSTEPEIETGQKPCGPECRCSRRIRLPYARAQPLRRKSFRHEVHRTSRARP